MRKIREVILPPFFHNIKSYGKLPNILLTIYIINPNTSAEVKTTNKGGRFATTEISVQIMVNPIMRDLHCIQETISIAV